jgi:hypothetical protein
VQGVQQEIAKAGAAFASNEQIEEFLLTAKIVKAKGISIGVAGPLKLTLDDGKIQHYAVYKSINERKTGVTQLASSAEIDFKDSWMFEVAAYELDKMLGLNMVPVTVARSYNGEKGSVQYWVDNCMMESDRLKKKLDPPDSLAWNRQMYKVRIFDNLVYNIDRNLGNLLITPDWKCYMIDHSRTFKCVDQLKSPKDMTQFSTSFMETLEKLDEESVKSKCGKYLTEYEIRMTLKRRDRILRLYKQMVAEKGAAVVYP